MLKEPILKNIRYKNNTKGLHGAWPGSYNNTINWTLRIYSTSNKKRQNTFANSVCIHPSSLPCRLLSVQSTPSHHTSLPLWGHNRPVYASHGSWCYEGTVHRLFQQVSLHPWGPVCLQRWECKQSGGPRAGAAWIALPSWLRFWLYRCCLSLQ